MRVPAHFSPYGFSQYSENLVKCWAAILLEIHSIFNDTEDFTVGFIFDENAEAEHEHDEHGHAFYIAPAVVRYNRMEGRSLAKRWKFTPAGKMALVMVALHEYVHKTQSAHDENYANILTDMAGVILKEKQRFHKCFR
jgi:hypothetical protein